MRADGGPIRWRWLGLAGSALLAVGAAGAGVLPRPDPLRHAFVLETLRHGAGRVVCIGVAAVGMLLLVAAWLLLGRCLDRTTPRDLCLTAALWSLPMVVAPPILSRDVYGYAVAGQMLRAGLNPYSHGAADLASSWVPSTSTSWLQVPLAYGPLFLLLARLVVAASGGSLTVALLGLRLIAIAGTLLLAWGLPRLARSCGIDERGALWLGLVNPLVLAHFVGGAHADALMLGLLVAGLALA
ncbi:MAG: polyprenol phosphomannose-dependent alpha 1,6 mannosyltransferase MptB, partial [Actinomycetota bacterium]|nr:polyprenol phosphomannose-dependent alpha 1,6 mannosyltransferase MptB [Actinomycetota bacterium]